MKVPARFLTFVLVGILLLGAAMPAAAGPASAPVAENSTGDTQPPPNDGQPTAGLGIAPDAIPQAGASLPDAGSETDATGLPSRGSDSPPIAMVAEAALATRMPEVSADELGIGADAAPQVEPLFVHAIYLPIVRGDQSTDEQAAVVEAAGVLAPTSPTGTVYAYSARTADASNVSKTVFNVGNAVRYFGVAYNATGAARVASFRWLLTGPCGSATLWSGTLNVAVGYNQWYIPGAIPNCPGSFTFTFQVTYAGATTSRSSWFTVNAPGTVAVSSAATQDNTGTARTSFPINAFIRYVGFLNNTTGVPRSTYLVYALAGPCGAGTVWSGWVTTAAGVQGWALDRTTPGCAGNYTLTVRATYNGYTTARSTNFSVFQPSTVAVTAVRTADRANNTRTTFAPGALMRYLGTLTNNTGASRSAYTVWSLTGPGCTGTLWAGTLTVAPGAGEWFLDGVAPNCLGNYTFSLAVTYSGQTTTRSSNYTVVASQ